jgi:hypothetical protein
MKYPIAIAALLTTVLSLGSGGTRLEIRDSTEIEMVNQSVRQIRWPKRTINVALSSSLQTPGPNIKPGSDVVGAARRALARWSATANLNFIITWSSVTSISPATAGDGVSIITIADTIENESFNSDSTAGRTRVFFDPQTGAIAEADISINPHPRSEEGAALQFSTDGTPGTYDLEATLTHEIGHLLGLDHSALLASTMQARQAFNGTFGQPAFSERTLTEDDRQRIRSLYGVKQRLGRIEGRLVDNRTTNTMSGLSGVQVWAESVATGRVVTSDVTDAEGEYRLEGLPAGQYRVLAGSVSEVAVDLDRRTRSFELSSQAAVKADAATMVSSNLIPSQPSSLNPRVIGLNGDLSTVALPLDPGRRVKIFLGGDGIDQVPGTSITINSPYFTLDPSTLTREQFPTPYPVVSIEMQVAPNAPFGDYSIKLQANSGEVAYVPAGITIDPGVTAASLNPIDDHRFFVRQNYSDLLGREPDLFTADKLFAQLAQCGNRSDCLRARRLDMATSLVVQNELPTAGVFLHALYAASLNRKPRLAEYEGDRAAMTNGKVDLEGSRLALAASFVRRQEFVRKYPTSMKSPEFVEALLNGLNQTLKVDLTSEKGSLVGLLDGTDAGRAQVLMRVATNPSVADASYNEAFVLTQYFAYLRRDPDDTGYSFWVNVLKPKPLRDPGAARSMVCAFINSEEYQNRFGMQPTRSPADCN